MTSLSNVPPYVHVLPAQFKGRIQALCTGVNVFRLLKLLSSHVGDVQLPLGRQLVRPHGVTITIKMDSVVKRIDNFDQQPNVNPNVRVLKKVDWHICCCVGLGLPPHTAYVSPAASKLCNIRAILLVYRCRFIRRR